MMKQIKENLRVCPPIPDPEILIRPASLFLNLMQSKIALPVYKDPEPDF
jgi:hypothetical protein